MEAKLIDKGAMTKDHILDFGFIDSKPIEGVEVVEGMDWFELRDKPQIKISYMPTTHGMGVYEWHIGAFAIQSIIFSGRCLETSQFDILMAMLEVESPYTHRLVEL